MSAGKPHLGACLGSGSAARQWKFPCPEAVRKEDAQ